MKGLVISGIARIETSFVFCGLRLPKHQHRHRQYGGTRTAGPDTATSRYHPFPSKTDNKGAINRHKDLSNRPETGESSHSVTKVTPPVPAYRARGGPASRRPYQRIPHTSSLTTASRGHPYSRGRAAAPISRHRTLIVNPQRSSVDSAQDTSSPSTTTTAQWVQKRDRHMQLINASVYEEQARQNEILETSKQRILDRQAKRDKIERTKLYGYLKRKGQGNKVSVCGILYRVTAQGNKLEKFQGKLFLCCLEQCDDDGR